MEPPPPAHRHMERRYDVCHTASRNARTSVTHMPQSQPPPPPPPLPSTSPTTTTTTSTDRTNGSVSVTVCVRGAMRMWPFAWNYKNMKYFHTGFGSFSMCTVVSRAPQWTGYQMQHYIILYGIQAINTCTVHVFTVCSTCADERIHRAHHF